MEKRALKQCALEGELRTCRKLRVRHVCDRLPLRSNVLTGSHTHPDRPSAERGGAGEGGKGKETCKCGAVCPPLDS